ncbi:unnamed protein product [Parnassius apollo]|uniref:(apollo) hypothetical protein n=1 Tax=Parnassius apollo TaxID=110799 RepID=A0A8S3WK91_PARAO|nr:unnamed protein product [Parnassius apollo]
MAFPKIIFYSIALVFIFIIQIESKPLEGNSNVALHNTESQIDGEIMDTAESQNPFLPRFAMRILKERREQARAQRRQNQAPRRSNVSSRVGRPCPQQRFYKK